VAMARPLGIELAGGLRKTAQSTFSDQESPHFTSPVPFPTFPCWLSPLSIAGPHCQYNSCARAEVPAEEGEVFRNSG
jgi:hypothetical protein